MNGRPFISHNLCSITNRVNSRRTATSCLPYATELLPYAVQHTPRGTNLSNCGLCPLPLWAEGNPRQRNSHSEGIGIPQAARYNESRKFKANDNELSTSRDGKYFPTRFDMSRVEQIVTFARFYFEQMEIRGRETYLGGFERQNTMFASGFTFPGHRSPCEAIKTGGSAMSPKAAKRTEPGRKRGRGRETDLGGLERQNTIPYLNSGVLSLATVRPAQRSKDFPTVAGIPNRENTKRTAPGRDVPVLPQLAILHILS